MRQEHPSHPPADSVRRVRSGGNGAKKAHRNGSSRGAPIRHATSAARGPRAAEQRYRRLFETSEDGILILHAGTGKIVDANSRLLELLGVTRGDLAGKKAWEPGAFENIVPDRAAFLELRRGHFHHGNKWLQTSDGHRIEVEFAGTVYRAGREKLVLCYIRDITERRQTEAAFLQFRAILESSGDAIASTDLDGIVTTWNGGAERIFGYEAREMIGQSIMRLIPVDQQDEERRILERVRGGESLENLPTMRRTKSGDLVYLSVTVSAIKDRDGKIVGISKVARDITLRKKHEHEIERLTRLYAALSQVNQAIVTVNTREELLAEICRVLVEVGNFRMAWVGWLNEKTRKVVPVAHWGDTTNYLSKGVVFADDRPEGRGPAGTAIREGRNCICNDFHHDPRTIPWREAAEQACFQSLASFVIRQGGAICGTMTVYAGETDYFQDNEIALLEKAAADISFGLDNFVREEAQRKGEAELLWKTAFLEAQVDSSIDGIVVVDRAGRKLLQNRRMNELWKIPPEIAGEENDSLQVEFASTRTKNPAQFKERIAHINAHPDEVSRDEMELSDGTFLDCYSSPVKDKTGKHYGRIWAFRDITERKRAETALMESKRFLRSSFDALTAHIAILDEGGTIISVNAAWKRAAAGDHFLGSNCGVGDNYLEFCDAAARGTSREAAAAARGIRDIIAGGPPGFIHEYTCHGQKEQRWFVLRGTRFDGGGQVRVVVAHENISDRKRSELRLSRLVNSNAQGVLFWNAKGQITDANAAFLDLVGYTRADLEAGPIDWLAMTPPEYADIDRQALKELAATGVCKPFEKEYIRKDGVRVPVLIGAATFEDNPTEGVCFVLDLTERKKLEAQFLRVQRMESIGTLAGGIAHDLNNVLAPILMAVEILGNKVSDDTGREVLGTLEASAQHGAELVKQVLGFARGMEGRHIAVNPAHILNEIQKIIRDTFPKNIQLHFTPSAGAWTVMGDATQLHQVFTNLCVNARDAMSHGGDLTVTMENAMLDEVYADMNPESKPGAYVIIKITDTGTGIPSKIKDRIFEPFFTTKDIGKGTGMGLSTTMAIVRSHGGFITVYSRVGRGTTFKVYLPASPTSLAAEASPVKTGLAQGNGELVLIVDDEEHIRIIARKTLEQFGYRVLLAADGGEAIALYVQHPGEIAAVLTDMDMPVMDGAATLVAIKAIDPQAKVIASSGLSTQGDITQAVALGFKHFIPKPYTARTMLEIVGKVVQEKA